MSQKSTRRARRQTAEEDQSPSLKAPKPNGTEEDTSSPFKAPVPNGTEEEVLPPAAAQDGGAETAPHPDENDAKIEQNGTEQPETENVMVTRSRSATPQVKKASLNGHDEEAPEKDKAGDLNASGKETETEMDPLIISDEPDPELLFEENSDLESGKSSPILNRCKTRRSQTRNIPTPKTPKLVEENDNLTLTPSPTAEEADTTNKDEDLNLSFESCPEDVSTKAEAGGDSTRLDYMNKEMSNLDNNSFLQEAKNKSFGETLRHLSTRRTIRPITEDYRKRLHIDKTDYGSSYPLRNSIERISSVKRKNSSDGEDGVSKKTKTESPGFFSRFTSPLTSIRNSFRSDIPTSTPKLTGYKDEKFMLEDEGGNSKMCEVKDGERRWCSIM